MIVPLPFLFLVPALALLGFLDVSSVNTCRQLSCIASVAQEGAPHLAGELEDP